MSHEHDENSPLAGISAARIANWERHGVEAIEADLINNHGDRYVGGPPGTTDQAWRWVRYKRDQEKARSQQPEIVTLTPGWGGFNINLVALFKRAQEWHRFRKSAGRFSVDPWIGVAGLVLL